MAGDDREFAFVIRQRCIGAYGRIKTEMGLAGGGVGAMAFETFVG